MALPAERSDQGAYLHYAQRLYETHGAFAGDRNRMPVFPWLLSLAYRPGMSEAEFLSRAQAFNIDLTVVLLLLLAALFRKFFSRLYAIALLAATAFGVLVYRASIVQVEPLFFFVSFIAFLLLVRMLARPGWVLAAAAGIVLGLAFLTKASALAALPCWLVIFGAQICFGRRGHRLRACGEAGFVVLGFLLVAGPYLRTSKAEYGSYFYNVNSAHYMWCDSWEEALTYSPSTRRASTGDLPSFAKYRREHSFGQAATRLGAGALSLLTRSAKAVGYYKYVALLALAAAVLSWRNRERCTRWLAANPFPAFFGAALFVEYFLLYAWYDAVVTDSRFVLTLFLPFVFAASIVIARLEAGKERLVALALIAFAAIDLIYNAGRIWQGA